jgi:hypothetical protein
MKLVKHAHRDVSQGLWCAALGSAAGNLPFLKERLESIQSEASEQLGV